MLVTESQDFSQQISNILGSLDYKCKKLVTNTSKVTIFRRNTNVISTDVDGNIDVGDGCWRQIVMLTSLRYSWPIQNIEKSPT